MPDVPQQFEAILGGGYRIERDLGGGGMSHVYVAEDLTLGRKVVVKLLSRELTDAVNTERFDREIKLAARLQHPHIVPLLTAGRFEGLPFFTMPLVEGASLRERIEAGGPLPVQDAVRVMRDVASALAYANEQGIVHRDIKPANILLSGDAALVTDFGVAKAISDSAVAHTALTSIGVSLGTPAYMAPEQAAGDPSVDNRADIYALGITAYEMLTGKAPFAGRSVPATLAAQMTERPVPVWNLRANLPAVLSACVMRCLEKEPAARPQDAAEIVRTLDALAHSDPASLADARRYLKSLGAPSPWRRRLPWMAAAAGVVVAGLAGWLVFRDRIMIESASFPASSAAAAPVKSIAVLPFSGSADSTEEYFRDGMAEQLIVTLNAIPGLRVASRTSAFTFKDRKSVSAADIGLQLHVDNLLEGSVRRVGDRLRVFVQLTNAKDGTSLWSGNFDARSADVFQMQDSISHAILDRLRVTLAGGTPRQLTHPGTADLAAYDLYLRARHQFNKFDEGPLRESIKLYDQALALDPRFAQAWSGIAESWIFLADDYVAPNIAYPAAKRAAEQALAFDSSLADAHAARGTALSLFEWNLAEGRSEVNKALALDPHSFLAQLTLYGLLVAAQKPDSAIAVLKAAQEADPLSVLNALILGRFYAVVGRPKDAILEYQRAMQLAPPVTPIALIGIGEAMIAQGDPAGANAPFAEARKMLGPDAEFLLAEGEAALGHRAEALRLVAQYEAVAAKTYVRPELIAAVYVRLGDRTKAFEWLDKSYEAHSPYLFALKVDREWDPIRTDPRFSQLVRKVGLP